MEPERRIEKLLRAFAKKRREQAPESMGLHSAMRQQLHRAIARRQENASGGFFARLFSARRPWLGFAAGFSALIVVCLLFLVPLMKSSKSERLAENTDLGKAPPVQGVPPAMAPPPPPVTTAPTVAVAPPVPEAPAIALNDKQTAIADDVPKHGNTKVEVADELAVREIQKPVEAAKDVASETNFAMDIAGLSAPASSNTEMLAFKPDNAVQTLSGGGAPLNNRATAQPPQAGAPSLGINASTPPATLAANEKEMRALAPQAAPAPAAADNATFYRLAQNGTPAAQPPPVSQRFYRLNLPANSPRAARAGAAPILATFRVEQNGDQLRMVDADGSVYTGNVQAAREAAYGAVNAAQNKPAALMKDGSISVPAAARNYFFRVAGTNRNLKQNIIFTGNFIPLTNTSSRPTNVGVAGGTISATRRATGETPVSPVWLLNSRISGNVTIGDQKQIEVNAAPTTK